MKASTAVVVAPEHRVRQADRPERQAGGDAERDVDEAHRADEEADVALRLAQRRQQQARACAAGGSAATVRSTSQRSEASRK